MSEPLAAGLNERPGPISTGGPAARVPVPASTMTNPAVVWMRMRWASSHVGGAITGRRGTGSSREVPATGSTITTVRRLSTPKSVAIAARRRPSGDQLANRSGSGSCPGSGVATGAHAGSAAEVIGSLIRSSPPSSVATSWPEAPAEIHAVSGAGSDSVRDGTRSPRTTSEAEPGSPASTTSTADAGAVAAVVGWPGPHPAPATASIPARAMGRTQRRMQGGRGRRAGKLAVCHPRPHRAPAATACRDASNTPRPRRRSRTRREQPRPSVPRPAP